MDSISNQVIHFYVVHVETVENSSRIERGLVKVLDKVETLAYEDKSADH